MRRPGVSLSPEVLLEEAKFILKTLLRDDLFGSRVKLVEAERVIDGSISLAFTDYAHFLSKQGYVRVDAGGQAIEVTDSGHQIVRGGDDGDLLARLQRQFARELGAESGKHSRSQLPAESRLISGFSDFPDKPEEIIDRRYRRGALIANGPLGVVFEGEHLSTGRPVALKEARAVFQALSYLKRDEIVLRLRKVVQRQARLVHPNIAQVFDQNHEREYPYFVMELAQGGNLRQRLIAQSTGRFSLSVSVRVLLQICYALKFAHQSGALHLGLKPENVLFDRLGNVKLADFGFYSVFERPEESAGAVLIGSGTVGYMAPERLQRDASASVLSAQADIYSLGILVYEMLTGKLPGRRSPLPSHARKEVPAAFDDVFDKMTRDELSERYRSIDEVLAGVYKAFPNKEVFSEGTILLWADDPSPLPEPEPELAPEPEFERTVERDRLEASRTPLEPPTMLLPEVRSESGILSLDEEPSQPQPARRARRPPPPPVLAPTDDV